MRRSTPGYFGPSFDAKRDESKRYVNKAGRAHNWSPSHENLNWHNARIAWRQIASDVGRKCRHRSLDEVRWFGATVQMGRCKAHQKAKDEKQKTKCRETLALRSFVGRIRARSAFFCLRWHVRLQCRLNAMANVAIVPGNWSTFAVRHSRAEDEGPLPARFACTRGAGCSKSVLPDRFRQRARLS